MHITSTRTSLVVKKNDPILFQNGLWDSYNKVKSYYEVFRHCLNQYSTIYEMLNICMLQKGILRDNLRRMLLESQVLKHILLCKYAM